MQLPIIKHDTPKYNIKIVIDNQINSKNNNIYTVKTMAIKTMHSLSQDLQTAAKSQTTHYSEAH